MKSNKANIVWAIFIICVTLIGPICIIATSKIDKPVIYKQDGVYYDGTIKYGKCDKWYSTSMTYIVQDSITGEFKEFKESEIIVK